jgi:uncharacterized protein with PIN domain
MSVGTSAVLAIVYQEEDAADFAEAIADATVSRTSAAST